VRNRIYGFECTKYREDGDEYNVVVRYEKNHRLSLEDVENIALTTPMGTTIYVKDVGEVVEELASPMIERENRQRIITVKGSVGAGVALGDAVAEVNALLEEYEVPEGLNLELGGSIEDQGEAFSDIGMLLILIVILVYIVMATQFESLVYPFIIMFTIPFAMSGVFIALWLTSTPLSIIALIGAIMLVGIVTKNGIVMVDYMNLLVERGSNVADAVIAGGKSRLRPVLMTSLTTILGMVPMAMGIGEGSEMWQPMGISVVGGLLMSTLLTLFIVPALYAMLQGRKERKAARKAIRQAEEDEFIRMKRLQKIEAERAAKEQNENNN
jgi:multidrug efflux pump subunit AcrB